MTKSTRNLMVLVGAVTILTVALFAVGPVLAQSGTSGSGQSGQNGNGNTVVVSTNETLGALVSRYNLSGTNLRDFLSANSSLPLVPGQRVVFPAGFNANIPTTGGTNSSSGQSATNTSTAVATSSSSSASSTGTPVATSAATSVATTSASSSSSSSSSTSSNSSTSGTNASGVQSKAQTYVVQPGDTLGTVLNMMGFVANTGTGTSSTAASTSTPVATMAATVAPTTAATVAATPMATTAATVAATAATGATAVATTASGGATAVATSASGAATTVVSTSTPVATTSASGTSGSSSAVGGPSDAQLLQWVRANSTLRFGLVVNLPAGIPATGSNSQGTSTGSNGTSGTSGSNGSNGSSSSSSNNNSGSFAGVSNGLASLSGKAASDAACSTGAPKGFGYYKVQGGDTVQSISKKFGVDVATILSMNRGSAFAKGSIIMLPGVEAPGMWNVKSFCGTITNHPGAENTSSK